MKLRTALFILFVVSSIVLWQIGGLANGLALASAVYAVLITFFLLILLWGFTKSQVSYLRKIEDSKKQVLEVEGICPVTKEIRV